ncbi:RING/FYVE/PHD zinc finger superfamily protein [Striga asiatica]|uniref:RING/FYVE/PHD zinc finger superfamily protein n=1 Tax=Striga asiatica TaxID=4170 RepID=A0A5A7QK07_STRAF|nr:RING/FYVE/PHD zinc finger superfamily protein [Striga asiatica]
MLSRRQDAANDRRVAAIYNLSRQTEWFGCELEMMGRQIADLSAEIEDIRLTILTMVRDKQTYCDAGNRGVCGGIREGRGGRGPGGVPHQGSPQPPSGDEDGEETVSEVNPFDDFSPLHVEANPFAAYGGHRCEEAAFARGYRARRNWGLDCEYGQWEGPFSVDIPTFDIEQVEEPPVTKKNLCRDMGIDENAVVGMDIDDCKIRSASVSIDIYSDIDASIVCDSCDMCYHVFCVGSDPKGRCARSWLCLRVLVFVADGGKTVVVVSLFDENKENVALVGRRSTFVSAPASKVKPS